MKLTDYRFFNSGDGWKLKIDANGAVVVQDGKPVYVKSDGTEVAIDINQTNGTISRLNREAQTHREAKEAAEAKARAFEGIDPTKAREAFDTLSKIDQKKLIDAGQVDVVKGEITKQYEEKLTASKKETDDIRNQYHSTMRSNAFSRSKFVTDKIDVPVDMVEAVFGGNFKVESDGQVRGYMNGQPVYSPDRPGEIASFDEALSVMVNGYANRDAILKGSGQSGSGSKGGAGGAGGARAYSRDEFARLAPAEQAKVAADARAGKATITD